MQILGIKSGTVSMGTLQIRRSLYLLYKFLSLVHRDRKPGSVIVESKQRKLKDLILYSDFLKCCVALSREVGTTLCKRRIERQKKSQTPKYCSVRKSFWPESRNQSSTKATNMKVADRSWGVRICTLIKQFVSLRQKWVQKRYIQKSFEIL